MRFFLDHDVPRAIRDIVERHEYSVSQVTDVLPCTASDEDVFQHAVRQECIMVTCNRNDFLALASHMPHKGLIILIRRGSSGIECMRLMQLIQRAGESGLTGNINFA